MRHRHPGLGFSDDEAEKALGGGPESGDRAAGPPSLVPIGVLTTEELKPVHELGVEPARRLEPLSSLSDRP